MECLSILSTKFDKEIEDANRDIEAYDCYLKSFKDKSYDMLSDEDFRKEKLKVIMLTVVSSWFQSDL